MSETGSAMQMVIQRIAGLIQSLQLIIDRLVIVIRNS
jgi:hypothetical protein